MSGVWMAVRLRWADRARLQFNSQQDLIDAVNLASTGKLRQVIDRTAPLSEVNDTLNALKNGEIAGRAVLTPHS